MDADWTAAAPDPDAHGSAAAPLDLDAVTADLDAVESALARLDAGTYWTDEVTGDALPEALLTESPTARRA